MSEYPDIFFIINHYLYLSIFLENILVNFYIFYFKHLFHFFTSENTIA